MRGTGIASLLVLALAGCAPLAPAPQPTLGPDRLCDTAFYTQTLDDPPDITATALDDLGRPFVDLVEHGIPVTCSARFTTADGAAFDVALVNLPVADLEELLDTVLGAGWTRAADATPTWVDDTDSGHRIQALEIEEGVLVLRYR